MNKLNICKSMYGQIVKLFRAIITQYFGYQIEANNAGE